MSPHAHGSSLLRAWFAGVVAMGCAGSRPEPVPENTTSRTVDTAARTPAPPPEPAAQPPSVASAAPPAADGGTASCHWNEELSAAFSQIAPNIDEKAWLATARSRLWPEVYAERALTGISQEIVSALAHKRYDKIAALVGPNGLCLRAAKGADCQTLSARELTACAHSGKRTKWAVDSGRDEEPSYTCSEAFRHIFYSRDFLRKGKPSYNCFPAPGRGNNGSPVIRSGPAHGYVELFDPGSDTEQYQSLWLVFDGEPNAPVLVEMISEYWGI
jgi:hypothetical protein